MLRAGDDVGERTAVDANAELCETTRRRGDSVVRRVNAIVGLILWLCVFAVGGYGVWATHRDAADGGAVGERPVNYAVSDDAASSRKVIAVEASAATRRFNSLGAFSLVDQFGNPVGREDLMGKPWIASFVFTRCTGPCSRLSASLESLVPYARDAGVRLVTFTVDPEFDSPDVLKAYASRWHAKGDEWLFLTGKKADIHALIRGGFQLPLQEFQRETRDAVVEIAHSTNFLLMDEECRIIQKFNGQIDADVAALRRHLIAMKAQKVTADSADGVAD